MDNISFLEDKVDNARKHYLRFVRKCQDSVFEWRLTPNSESTPFALIFGIFCLHLVGETDEILSQRYEIAEQLKKNLQHYKQQRKSVNAVCEDKPFLQLLTFTLSCLWALGLLRKDPLESFVVPCLPKDISLELDRVGALQGQPQSGNFAMFMAILLIHARDYLGIDTQNQIDTWAELHLSSMNEYGFWGDSHGMSHWQFQNGYHQYEILEYLGVNNPKSSAAADAVASLVDKEGHFAPYPGGGGCFDYDAVSILTSSGYAQKNKGRNLLLKTATVILSQQNDDGGFADSHRVRPRSIRNIYSAIQHVFSGRDVARKERFFQCLKMIFPKHDKVHTHWSKYSREWSESNLWDSWFRLLTVARIECNISSNARNQWGFIDYPGIGFFRGAEETGKTGNLP